MSKKSEELIDEAHENLSKDRERLEEFADMLLKVAGITVDDPMVKIALAENFAKITDGLTKNIAQLVELAKLRAKKELFKGSKDDGFDDSETDGMFDDIERAPDEDDGEAN